MAAFSLLLILYLPMALGSIAVACLPLRSTRVRVVVLGLLVVASVTVMAWLEADLAVWAVIALAPGLLIAAGRLIAEVVGAVRRKREAVNP